MNVTWLTLEVLLWTPTRIMSTKGYHMWRKRGRLKIDAQVCQCNVTEVVLVVSRETNQDLWQKGRDRNRTYLYDSTQVNFLKMIAFLPTIKCICLLPIWTANRKKDIFSRRVHPMFQGHQKKSDYGDIGRSGRLTELPWHHWYMEPPDDQDGWYLDPDHPEDILGLLRASTAASPWIQSDSESWQWKILPDSVLKGIKWFYFESLI